MRCLGHVEPTARLPTSLRQHGALGHGADEIRNRRLGKGVRLARRVATHDHQDRQLCHKMTAAVLLLDHVDTVTDSSIAVNALFGTVRRVLHGCPSPVAVPASYVYTIGPCRHAADVQSSTSTSAHG